MRPAAWTSCAHPAASGKDDCLGFKDMFARLHGEPAFWKAFQRIRTRMRFEFDMELGAFIVKDIENVG